MKILAGEQAFIVEPTIRISELIEMIRRALGYHSGYTRLEINGVGLAAAASLADYLPDPNIPEQFVSVYNAPEYCCHGSPYDPESGGYLCGKC